MELQSPWWDGPDVIEVREASMNANETFLRLMPGTPTSMDVTLDNQGNTDIDVHPLVDGLPDSWSTWWRVNEENITMPSNSPFRPPTVTPRP